MTILEIALQLGHMLQVERVQLANKVRFCWWGAEEVGLKGSEHYVAYLNQTDQAELSKIALALNFDMVGSPNFIRGVYNGTQGLEYGDQPSDVKQYVGHASEYITELLVSYFDSNNLAYDLTDFSGRSDYGPFLDFGIPAGGLDTGADGIKTEDERHRFGGMVGIQHDPCYHLHCDTIENLSQEALRDMSAAASYGLERLLAAPALGAWLDASTHNEQQLPTAFTKAPHVPQGLEAHVSAVNITRHLEKLQEIAFASGGHRSVGSIGYNRSIEYVRSTLASSTDYLLSSQDFTYTSQMDLEPPTLEQVLPSAASLVLDTEFNKMSGSGSGSVEAEVAHAANRGCDEADFDGTSFKAWWR